MFSLELLSLEMFIKKEKHYPNHKFFLRETLNYWLIVQISRHQIITVFYIFQFKNNSLWWYIDCFSVIIQMKNTIYCSLKFIVWNIYILSDVAYFSRGASFMTKCVEQFVKKGNITINLTLTFISWKRVVIIQFGLKPSSFVKEKKIQASCYNRSAVRKQWFRHD